MSIRALTLIVLAACELQPAPKKQAEPPPPPPAAQVEAAKPVEAIADAGVAADAAGAGSGSAAKIEITAPCLEVSAKLAQVFIDVQTDPGAKSNAEQARGDMIRKMGEACTVQAWSTEARACFMAAKNEPDIRACEKKFPAPRPPTAPKPVGGVPPPNP